jgi:pyruvate,water dikinase
LTEQQDICALREDESAARAALQTYRQDGGRAWRELVSKRTEGVEEAERRVLGRLRGARRAIYRYVLGLARRYFPLRTDRDEPVLLSWILERDVVLEVGRRLCATGAASRPEDASFLGCRELVDYLEGRMSREKVVAILTEREVLYRRWWRYAPPDVLGGPLHPRNGDADKAVDAEDLLRGLAVSPGTAKGRARVTNTLVEAANLLPGEVLVCREPLFELSPLFGVASAVVAESGTLLGHAAILAREYGVPAVFGVEKAAERIRNGEELWVDGSAGLVSRRQVEPELDLL